MHIPDGFLAPPVIAGTFALSAGGIACGLRSLNRRLTEKHVPLLGVMGAFIFAAQMLNFPVLAGTSGHLLGAALAAILLGPWAAAVLMTCILVIQSLVFQDGGLLALGANILNMALIACLSAAYSHRALARLLPGRKGNMTAAFLSAWSSVALSAAAAALELAYSGLLPVRAALPAVTGVHMFLGLGEGTITVAVLALIQASRRDLLELQKT